MISRFGTHDAAPFKRTSDENSALPASKKRRMGNESADITILATEALSPIPDAQNKQLIQRIKELENNHRILEERSKIVVDSLSQILQEVKAINEQMQNTPNPSHIILSNPTVSSSNSLLDSVRYNSLLLDIQNGELQKVIDSGNLPLAEEMLKSGQLLGPKNILIQESLGFVLYQQGKYRDAEVTLVEALEINPESVPALYGYAQTLCKLEKWGEAVFNYEKALSLEPENSTIKKAYLEAQYQFLILYIQTGQLQQMIDSGNLQDAEAMLRDGQNLGPKNILIQESLGYVLYHLGKYSEAETALREALTINSESAPALFGLAQTLCKLGKWDEAGLNYEKALIIEPNPMIQKAYTDWLISAPQGS